MGGSTTACSSSKLVFKLMFDNCQGDPDQQEAVEVVARAQPHCWGVAKHAGDSLLVLPLEQHKGDSLLEASATAEAFAEHNCPGVFL